MKTTIQIPDSLLEEARKIAAQENSTLKVVVEEGLRRIIAERKKAKPFTLRKATFKGHGLHPDLTGATWDRIRELSYRERGG